MSRLASLGIALLLVGLLVVGVGAAVHVRERQCQLLQTVNVTDITDVTDGTNSTNRMASANKPSDAPTALPRVAYADLSPEAREVFEEALAANQTVITKRGAIDPAVVTYEGERYLVEVGRGEDCSPFDPLTVQAPIAGGLGLVVVGAALARWRGPEG